MALGGVAIGIIKAQLAANTNGNVMSNISILLLIANALRIGKNKKVVAVLLVNSVIKDVRNAIKKIIKKIFKKEM